MVPSSLLQSEAELADGLFVDLGQGAEALLVGGSAVHGPVGAVRDGGRSGFLAARDGEEQGAEQQEREADGA